MAKQNAVLALKESIRRLEIRQEEEGKILKEQFKITYESLKPLNLIKNSLRELANSVDIKNSIFETVVSIVSGYVSQKFIVNSKSSTMKKILGVLMQFGVTSFVSKKSEEVGNFLSNFINRLFTPAEVEE
jgi:hypothetical protein